MISFENRVEIKRPVGEVYAYVADLENVPNWNYAINETRKVTPGDVGVGTVYLQIRTLPGRSEEQLRVAEWVPPHLFRVEGQLGPFDADMRYDFAQLEGRTSVTNTVELNPSGVAGFVAQLAGSRIETAVAENLEVLKKILES